MYMYKRQGRHSITVVVYIFTGGIASRKDKSFISTFLAQRVRQKIGQYEIQVFLLLPQDTFQDHRVMIGRYKIKILCDNRFYFKV